MKEKTALSMNVRMTKECSICPQMINEAIEKDSICKNYEITKKQESTNNALQSLSDVAVESDSKKNQIQYGQESKSKYMREEKIVTKEEERKGIQLLIGILGIYTCYWSGGYLQEKILKTPYQIKDSNDSIEPVYFDSPISLIWTQALIAWLIGYLINKKFYQPSTKLPARKMIICAILVTVSALSSILAIKITSFPIVMMIKSCSIIPVVFVGIFCSRVKNDELKLGVEKIIIAICISIGILVYNIGGNEQIHSQGTSVIGILLMLVSITSDGFLPDVQAVIKSELNPRPTEMFEHTNKFVTIIALLYAGATGSITYFVNFSLLYPQLLKDLLLLSTLSAVGQIFVYRLVKSFKQHIVPFVITTRKIFTVVISIILYKHETSVVQCLGIGIVFFSAIYEYCAEIFWNGRKKKLQQIHLDVIGKDEVVISDMVEQSETERNLQDEPTPSSKEKLEVAS